MEFLKIAKVTFYAPEMYDFFKTSSVEPDTENPCHLLCLNFII